MSVPSTKTSGTIALVLAVIIAMWCVRLWQPERQIRLHQRHLLEAAENRNWKKLKLLLDDDFKTPNGIDKKLALGTLAEALRPFMSVHITGTETHLDRNGRVAKTGQILRLDGMGSAFAEAIKSAVNQSNDPFEFTWERKSWKPWDWRLVRVEHPLLNFGPQEMPF